MKTALQVIQARVAGEDNAVSGLINLDQDDLKAIKSIRVGGFVFRRWAPRVDSFVHTLRNGVMVACDLNDGQISVEIRSSLSNGDTRKSMNRSSEFELACIDISAGIPIPEDNYDEGIDLRKANKAVEQIMQYAQSMDNFAGTLLPEFDIGDIKLKAVSHKLRDTSSYFAEYVDAKHFNIYFELSANRAAGEKPSEPVFSITIEGDKLHTTDNNVVSINETIENLSFSKVVNFDGARKLIDKELAKSKVSGMSIPTALIDVDGQSQRVPIADKKAFNKELTALLEKHRFTAAPMKKAKK